MAGWRMGGGSWVDGGGWAVVVVEWHEVNSGDGGWVAAGWRGRRTEGWAGGGVEVRMAGAWAVGRWVSGWGWWAGDGRKREVVVLLVVLLKCEGRWRVVGWRGVGKGGWL